MRRAKSEWLYLFFEYLLMALADGLVLLVGWVARKAYKRWKRRDDEPDDPFAIPQPDRD